MASAARIDRMLEASEEPMVRVAGGRATDFPAGNAIVTVTVFPLSGAVELPFDDEGVAFLQPVRPPWAPVALMIDSASTLLVQARNIPLDLTNGKAKHDLDFPPEHFSVSQAPFLEHWAGNPDTQATALALQRSVAFKVINSALSCCAAMPFCNSALASSVVGADDANGTAERNNR